MGTDTVSKERIFSFLGYEPHPMQREVHASTAQRRVLACGVRWGKSTAAAMEVLSAALVPTDSLNPRRGWIVAPNYDLADKVFREVVLVAREKLAPFVDYCSENERTLILSCFGGGICEIRGKTADNPVSLLGEGLDFLVVDEAARLKPDIWDRYLQARLVDKHGWAILISTPKGKGWFYDAWRCKSPGWQSWSAPSWTNPHLSQVAIDQARARVPESIFNQEFGAQFLEGAGQVFRNVRDLATGTFAEPEKGKQYFAGLDLARVHDYTVMTVLDRDRHVVAFDRYTRLDWSTQVTRIHALAEKYNKCPVLVDSTGAGEPVYEKLREANVRAEPYLFTVAGKASLINNLSMMLEQKRVTLPKSDICPEMIDELEAFEYSVTDGGNVRTEAPSGQHDDCVISLCLAAWLIRKDPVRMVARWT